MDYCCQEMEDCLKSGNSQFVEVYNTPGVIRIAGHLADYCPFCGAGYPQEEEDETPAGYELWPLAVLRGGIFVIEPEWGSEFYRPYEMPQTFPERFCGWCWIDEEDAHYCSQCWRLAWEDRPAEEYHPEPDGIDTADYALMKERG